MQYMPNLPEPRRALAVPLMAAAVLGAGVATATFALVNIEDDQVVSLPTPAAEPAAIPSDAVAGQRADGGPEEGIAVQSIRAEAVAVSASATAAGTRYDGGPEEGTRGTIAEPQVPAGVRYDGGPEEGTRGAVTEPQPPEATP
jgi:hypothetical protein